MSETSAVRAGTAPSFQTPPLRSMKRSALSREKRYSCRSMSMIGDKYILTGSGRSDHDRLRVISEIHDGRTRELLLRAGFAPGHRFVEFGCGLGYVARWAAGQGAHATGIDLNPEQIAVADGLAREAGLHTAQFRLGNVYEPGLEPAAWICLTRAG